MIAENTPIENGANGASGEREKNGRFAVGNKGGPGNPYMRRAAKWRTAFAKAITPDDISETVRQLIAQAREGEPWAVRELLDRTLGKAPDSIIPDEEDAGCVPESPSRRDLEEALLARSRNALEPKAN